MDCIYSGDVRYWLSMKDRIEERVLDIVGEIEGHSIDHHEPTIHWPEEGEDTITVCWTEYGAYGSEWDFHENIPLHWLSDPDWFKEHQRILDERARQKVEKEREEKEEKERKDKAVRRAQYLRLKEEFSAPPKQD